MVAGASGIISGLPNINAARTKLSLCGSSYKGNILLN